MQDAIARSKEKRINLVTHLVAANLATARDIAISASNEFGVPLLDLDAVAADTDAIRAVSDKLLLKHRVLPLMKRGKRLFLAVADPTNLHALDEIRFQTSMSIEFVVVEDDKLQAAVSKAIEQAESVMPNLTDDDFDLENLEVTGGDDDPNADALGAMTSKTRRSCASSIRSCSTPSRRAPPTSTSSPMKRCSASGRGWTAFSRRSPCLPCSSP